MTLSPNTRKVFVTMTKYHAGCHLSTIFWGPRSPRWSEWMESYATKFDDPSPELDDAMKQWQAKYPNFSVRSIPC